MRRRVLDDNKLDNNTLLLLRGDSFIDKSRYNQLVINKGCSITDGHFDKGILFNGGGLNIGRDSVIPADGDFTIDFWCKLSRMNRAEFHRFNVADNTNLIAGFGTYLTDYGGMSIALSYNGSAWDDTSTGFPLPMDGGFHHYSQIRNSGYINLYLDGFLKAQKNVGSKSLYCGKYNYIGYVPGGTKIYGIMSEFRISDIARWTSNFTPPTKPY